MFLILADVTDYDFTFAPTHILGKDDFIPVYLGKFSNQEKFTAKEYGIYVCDKDYEKIDHKKTYIIIHDPDINNNKFDDIKKQFKDNLKDIEDENT